MSLDARGVIHGFGLSLYQSAHLLLLVGLNMPDACLLAFIVHVILWQQPCARCTFTVHLKHPLPFNESCLFLPKQD